MSKVNWVDDFVADNITLDGLNLDSIHKFQSTLIRRVKKLDIQDDSSIEEWGAYQQALRDVIALIEGQSEKGK